MSGNGNDGRYDLIIIGGGPAGYLAAERAAGAGQTVLLAEEEHLGGVCLNWGCIPTKTLLHSAKVYHAAAHAERFGVTVRDVRYDLAGIMAWKREVVQTQRGGVEKLMKRGGVTVVSGRARLAGRDAVSVEGRTYRGRNVLIAAGSAPVRLPIPGADGPTVHTSREILDLERLPSGVAVIGGGVIGLEFASYFSLLGIPVTVIEMLPEILPSFDRDIGALLRRAMPDVTFLTGSKVESVAGGAVSVAGGGAGENGANSTVRVEADLVLMAAGRRPNVTDLGLQEAGIDFDAGGVRVDERMRTNVPGILAAGDVTGRSLLAHSAYRMAEVAVSTVTGGTDRMRYDAIPWVVYSEPEVAGVGLTEAQAAARGRPVESVKVPLRINGRYMAEHGDEPGICKVMVDRETGVLAGMAMVGGHCSEIIYGAAAMLESELRVRDIREIVFPHPTVSEVIRDAVWRLRV